jgi:5-deoxy-glucuronate isomerase
MPLLLHPSSAAKSGPVVAGGQSIADLCHFELLELGAGESASVRVPDFELLAVVLSGQTTIVIDRFRFENVGQRENIWSGLADSVYAGTRRTVQITAGEKGAEVAIAGGRCTAACDPFRIAPSAVEMVDVGSVETHSRRRIFHILGQNPAGPTGNLLVSELYADPGCWSGYPPHKHDTERPPEETDFQELYHYRFNPVSGFGTQHWYTNEADAVAFRTGHQDTFLIERGYHPTSTSPGHAGYIFTVLVGRHQRSLIQYFEPKHRHLLAGIPGIQAMRDKFK